MTAWKSFSVSVATLLSMMLPATASAEVEVRFLHPERYADAGASEASRARTLAILERHLKGAVQPCMGERARLVVDVLDVDLAGETDWMRADAGERRVLRELSPPSMELDWTLADGRGLVVAGKRERVSDMEYLRNATRAHFSREVLPYERLMLEDWARSRLCWPSR